MGGTFVTERIDLSEQLPFRRGRLCITPALRRIVRDDGADQVIEPRVMQVLCALHHADGAVLSRQQLLTGCWNGRTVSNDAVNRVISQLHALSGGVAAGSFRVETVSRVGYRLIEIAGPEPDAPSNPTAETKTAKQGRRTAIGLLLAGGTVGMLGVGWVGRHALAPATMPTDGMTLLVLPFTAGMSASGAQDVAHSATMAIRNDLDHVPGLKLVDGLTSVSFAQQNLSAQQLGERTGAGLILTGLLKQGSDVLNLTLTLTDASNGHQLWSDGIDAAQSQWADLQRDAAGMVVEQLLLRLPFAGRPTTARQRGDPEAYRLSQQARTIVADIREALLHGDRERSADLADQASSLADRSLALEPENSEALVVMADLTRHGWSRAIAARQLTTQQRVTAATLLLRRALRSEPTSAPAMARLADIYRRFSWRWDDAQTLFRHALTNDPADADAHWAYSHELATLGQGVEGLRHALSLWAIDDVHLWRRITLPRMLLFLGIRDQAMIAYFRELRRAPASPYLLYELYYLHVAAADPVGLRQFVDGTKALWRGQQMPVGVVNILNRSEAALAAMAGQPASLLGILDSELASFDAGGMSAATLGGRARDDIIYILAIEYGCAGAHDKAIDLLDRALQAMSVYWLSTLPYGNSPFPAPMVRNPRFQALWRRDPRLADAVERRRRAAAAGQMAAKWPDGRETRGQVPVDLQPRLAAVMAETGTA